MSRVPCPVCFWPFWHRLCPVPLFSEISPYPLSIDQYYVDNSCRVQNAECGQSKARRHHIHTSTRPRVVAAGSRSATSGGNVQYCACYSPRDTAQTGAAVSVSAGGSCPRSSLHNITIFNFAQNVRARVRSRQSSTSVFCANSCSFQLAASPSLASLSSPHQTLAKLPVPLPAAPAQPKFTALISVLVC